MKTRIIAAIALSIVRAAPSSASPTRKPPLHPRAHLQRSLPRKADITMKSKFLLSILTAVLLAGNAHAQYTGDNQTNTISGVASNWVGDYSVGDNFVYDALVIQTGGVLSNGFGYVGYQFGADNNTVLVTGSGSVWSNANDLYVGFFGALNSLTI